MKYRLFIFLLVANFLVLNAQVNVDYHSLYNVDLSVEVTYGRALFLDIDADGDNDYVYIGFGELMVVKYLQEKQSFGIRERLLKSSVSIHHFEIEDVDNDGDLDIITFEKTTQLYLYENDGHGNFYVKHLLAEYSFDGEGGQIKAVDLDNDGDKDIAHFHYVEKKIYLYKNTDGLGKLDSFQTIEIGNEISSVIIENLDDDPDKEIIVSLRELSEVVVYKKNGDGIYEEIFRKGTGSVLMLSVQGADIDGDNDIDLIASCISEDYSEGEIIVFRNTDGNAAFEINQKVILENKYVDYFSLGDIDGDGDIDIMTEVYHSWIENIDGSGTFGAVHEISINEFSQQILVDFDDDGDLDILCKRQRNLGILENVDSQGTFSDYQALTIYIARVFSTEFGDVDGDGDLDMVIATLGAGNHGEQSTLSWLENDGQGNYFYQNVIDNGDFIFGHLSDLDNDGDLDIFGRENSELGWYINDGDGGFSFVQKVDDNIQRTSAIDVDGDSDLDLVFDSESNLMWSENLDGNGTFSTAKLIAENIFGIQNVQGVDIDNDSDLDLVYSYGFPNKKIIWLENIGGSGNTWLEHIIDQDISDSYYIESVDLDGDDNLDIIFNGNNKVFVAYNTDGLATYPDVDLLIDDDIRIIHLVDFDSDGDLDLTGLQVQEAPSRGHLSYFENINELGGFGNIQKLSENTYNYRNQEHITSADLNGDFSVDIIVGSNALVKIDWYENLGVNKNQIHGQVLFDSSEDGCTEGGTSMHDVLITTGQDVDRISTGTSPSGFYQFFVEEGSFTTRIPALPSYLSYSPQEHFSDLSGLDENISADFCVSALSEVEDLNVVIFPLLESSPGFLTRYRVIYRNVGTMPMTGTIELTFDPEKMDFKLTNGDVVSQTDHSFTFEFKNLAVFEKGEFDLDFVVKRPPVVWPDETLVLEAKIRPKSNDLTPDDNDFVLYDKLVSSFDPNDIRVLEGEELPVAEIDNYLHYIIRFQNVGTAFARKVLVENMLDERLDWNSFQLESSSHKNEILIEADGMLSFVFDGIYLADSTSNEAESHGFICYKIKPKENVLVGDLIYNQADIFFDFNSPVQTNQVQTEIVEPMGLNSVEFNDFIVYPNPVLNVINVKSSFLIKKIEVYSVLGVLLDFSFRSNTIDVSGLDSGLYFVKVYGGNNELGLRLVAIKPR